MAPKPRTKPKAPGAPHLLTLRPLIHARAAHIRKASCVRGRAATAHPFDRALVPLVRTPVRARDAAGRPNLPTTRAGLQARPLRRGAPARDTTPRERSNRARGARSERAGSARSGRTRSADPTQATPDPVD